MKWALWCVGGILFALSAQAQVPSMDCDMLMNSLVAPQGATWDMKKGFKPLFSYENGKLVVDKTNPAYRSYEKHGDKEVIDYNYQQSVFGVKGTNSSIPARGRLELQTTPDGYVIATYMDENAEAKANDRMRAALKAKGYNMTGGLMMGTSAGDAMSVVGAETSVAKSGNGCLIDQNTLMSRFGKKGDIQRTVFNDRKYCDSVKDILRKVGKESYQKCEGTLMEAEQAYQKRAMELAKDKKMFTPPGHSGMMNGSTGMTLWALNSCSPAEWGKNPYTSTYGYGFGLGMYGSGNYGMPYVAPDAPKAQKGSQ